MEIDNTANILDSRDIIKRIDELECYEAEESEARDDLAELLNDPGATGPAIEEARERVTDAEDAWDADDREELKLLRAFADEMSCADWHHGETLIHDSYFRDYAEQMAIDIGAISGNESWPLSFIDWDAAVEALKQDYISAELDGETYWARG